MKKFNLEASKAPKLTAAQAAKLINMTARRKRAIGLDIGYAPDTGYPYLQLRTAPPPRLHDRAIRRVRPWAPLAVCHRGGGSALWRSKACIRALFCRG